MTLWQRLTEKVPNPATLHLNNIYILSGSNLGDREKALTTAKQEIQLHCGSISACSSIYESDPWGFDSDEKFLNQVILLTSKLGPYALLAKLQEIEKKMGRIRTKSGYESRIIDLDILYFNDEIIQNEALKIPHPAMHQRAFTMVPMEELAPNFLHPILKISQKEILSALADKKDIKRFKATEKIQD
jgi:2-amino-4-hydroxy-6-hydroxymethyldihydropteridine diphosphokinase